MYWLGGQLSGVTLDLPAWVPRFSPWNDEMMYRLTKMYVICIGLMNTQPSLHLQIKVLELDNFVGLVLKWRGKLVKHRAGTGVTGMELRAVGSGE